MNFENRIHELRKKQNLSQEHLAEKVGVARQTISKWELGETAPDINQAKTLSQIFNISLDILVGNEANVVAGDMKSYKRKISKSMINKIIAVSATVLCLCLAVAGLFSIVNRLQIMHPQKTDSIITRNNSIQIEKGDSETIVYSELDKPTILCELPEGFVLDADRAGLYMDDNGNFIKFNADYEPNVVNPLFTTDYYSYYEDRGYHSYMDMARAAMYYDYPKLGVFSSKEKIYLAGGAQLIREQLCAGQDADYYAINGGLTESGDKMRLYGFALHFDDIAWQILLKDCNDVYYFITIKDPNGIGKTIDTVGEFLSSISISE